MTSFNTTGTGAASRGYGYDNASQLTSKTGTGAESYTYDDNGNRTGSHTTGLANRLTSDGTYTYDYDKEGNIVRRTPLTTPSSANPIDVYGYDQRGRLVGRWQFASTADADAFQNWIHSITYTYDLAGRRVRRALDANGAAAGEISNEYFVYDGDNLALRFGNSGELTHRYQYGPAVDQVLADEVFNAAGQSAEVLWLLGDHQGSVRDIINHEGVTRKHVDYDSFGKITGEQTYGAAVEQLFYFQGREWDKDAKLQQNRARWYDPAIGRFLSEDPSGFDGGDANFYRYVHNNPVMYVDPSGLRQQGNPLDSLFGNHNARVPVPTSLLSQPSLFGYHSAAARPTSTGASLGTIASILGNSVYNAASNYVAQTAKTAASVGASFAAFIPTIAQQPAPATNDRYIRNSGARGPDSTTRVSRNADPRPSRQETARKPRDGVASRPRLL